MVFNLFFMIFGWRDSANQQLLRPRVSQGTGNNKVVMSIDRVVVRRVPLYI